MAPLNFHISQLIVFLVAAGLVVPLAQRFRISPVLGFLLIGLLIGPHGLGRLAIDHPWVAIATIDDEAGVHVLGEFGVVLLLFVIGLELSLGRLIAMRRLVFGLGASQVLVTSAIIGLAAYGFGSELSAAVVIGVCLALSSTAIVLQLLTEAHRIGSQAGRAMFAILLFQDLAVVPLLVLVEVFGKGAGHSVALALGAATIGAMVAIAAIMAIGNLVIRPLFRLVGATRSRELFMATVLLTVLATGLATAYVGLSMALGAFLAGLLLADTEYRHQVEVDIEPFKGLFLGVFFLSVGMRIDPMAIVANPGWIAAAVFGLLATKAAVLFGLCLAFRYSRAVAAEVALTAGQAGEFAFVVIGLAVTLGVVPRDQAQFVLIVVGLSMVVTPLVARFGRSLASGLESPAAESGHDLGIPDTDLSGHVILAGYGRVGRLLGSLLAHEDVPFIALDTSSQTVAAARKEGAPVFVGDASRPEFLERVGLDHASAFVVTMDSADAAERVVGAVRAARPQMPIYARARDTAHALRLLSAGATHVIPETVEASLQLGEIVLTGVGLPEDAARTVVEAARREETARYGG